MIEFKDNGEVRSGAASIDKVRCGETNRFRE